MTLRCGCCIYFVFFFKQKTAYELRISDWSSDVCSSDLRRHAGLHARHQTRSWLGQRHHAALVPLIIFCLPLFPSRQMIPSGSTSLYLRRCFAKKRTTTSYTCFDSGKIGRASCRERVCQYV